MKVYLLGIGPIPILNAVMLNAVVFVDVAGAFEIVVGVVAAEVAVEVAVEVAENAEVVVTAVVEIDFS